MVPTLYAAESEVAAVCETLLHDIPATGGVLLPDQYLSMVLSRLTTKKDLVLASFMGTGLRALGVEAEELTASEAAYYGETVKWAKAAHEAEYDGIVWMSHRCNTDHAYIFFGDRVASDDLRIETSGARAFALEPDLAWLTDLCGPLRIEVRWG